MKTYNNITRNDWTRLMARTEINKEELNETVSAILKEVELTGDEALRKYSLMFDSIQLKSIALDETEFVQAETQICEELKKAINTAYKNIYAFHKAQETQVEVIETTPGVKCWRKSVAIEKVGLYIPGGSAPLFSTILMLGIPAQIAGCKELVLCTPPDENGEVNPAILYTAKLVGISKVYKVGGAQAIGAMAYGTESILKVDKIFGPGNQYVTKAKELIQQTGTAIDMPAGPSEVLVIADTTCNPAYVASDLLSQAEHGEDSQVILLSTDTQIIEKCLIEVNKQLELLPRKETARVALNNSKAIILESIDNCFEFSNSYAPEHLIIASERASKYIDKINNAGSVFLGNYSCESAGDYASGTNHTLPTNGYARSYSGVSLDSFVKKITFQELTKQGIQNLGETIELMAEAEGLFAHKNAVTIRLKDL